MTDYKPGTLAIATVRGVPNVRIMATSGAEWVTSSGHAVSDRDGDTTGNVADIRPLAVLDPDDYEQVSELAEAIWNSKPNLLQDLPACVEQGLRSIARPPKPAEPTGLGAVVEDADGDPWLRCGGESAGSHGPGCRDWRLRGMGDMTSYANIDAVRVLSDGVTA